MTDPFLVVLRLIIMSIKKDMEGEEGNVECKGYMREG